MFREQPLDFKHKQDELKTKIENKKLNLSRLNISFREAKKKKRKIKMLERAIFISAAIHKRANYISWHFIFQH